MARNETVSHGMFVLGGVRGSQGGPSERNCCTLLRKSRGMRGFPLMARGTGNPAEALRAQLRLGHRRRHKIELERLLREIARDI